MRHEARRKSDWAWNFVFALAEAFGVFLLLCGIFHIRVEEIGSMASLGYVLGLCGIFWCALVLFNSDVRRSC